MNEREKIKSWLKSQHMSREEFGKKVGVSKSSVDNWLAGVSPIPAGRLALIRELMTPAPAPAPEPPSPASFKVLNVILSRDEFALCVAAAKKEGVSVEDWARRIVLERTAAVAPPTAKGASS